MSDNSVEELIRLEQQVERLIRTCEQLRAENRTLRAGQNELEADRAALTEKNHLARERIEAIVERLKTMEQT